MNRLLMSIWSLGISMTVNADTFEVMINVEAVSNVLKATQKTPIKFASVVVNESAKPGDACSTIHSSITRLEHNKLCSLATDDDLKQNGVIEVAGSPHTTILASIGAPDTQNGLKLVVFISDR